MEPYAEVDDSNFPMVWVRFTGQEPTDDNFHAYLRDLDVLYEREKPLALIFDARQANLSSFRYQKMQAEWLKENDSLIRRYCTGTAYIISNILVGAVLRGIFLLQPQPVPYEVVRTSAAAREWAERQLGLR